MSPRLREQPSAMCLVEAVLGDGRRSARAVYRRRVMDEEGGSGYPPYQRPDLADDGRVRRRRGEYRRCDVAACKGALPVDVVMARVILIGRRGRIPVRTYRRVGQRVERKPRFGDTRRQQANK